MASRSNPPNESNKRQAGQQPNARVDPTKKARITPGLNTNTSKNCVVFFVTQVLTAWAGAGSAFKNPFRSSASSSATGRVTNS